MLTLRHDLWYWHTMTGTVQQVKAMHLMDPMATCPFVHSTLQDLRREVGNEATVLGFVGLPYTLATYLVEGQGSKVSRDGHYLPHRLSANEE